MPGKPTYPAIEVILTICPRRLSRMYGSTAFIIATAPNTFTFELPLYFFQRRLFENTFVPISGIVHENVYRTYFAFKLRDRRTNRHEIGDIE
jgi:hypothetical protein